MSLYESDEDVKIEPVVDGAAEDVAETVKSGSDEPAIPKKVESVNEAIESVNKQEMFTRKIIGSVLLLSLLGAGAFVMLKPQPAPVIVSDAVSMQQPTTPDAHADAANKGMALTTSESPITQSTAPATVFDDGMSPKATTSNAPVAKVESVSKEVSPAKAIQSLTDTVKPVSDKTKQVAVQGLEVDSEARLTKNEKDIESIVKSISKLNEKIDALSKNGAVASVAKTDEVKPRHVHHKLTKIVAVKSNVSEPTKEAKTTDVKSGNDTNAKHVVSGGKVLGETDDLIWKESADGDLSIQHKN